MRMALSLMVTLYASCVCGIAVAQVPQATIGGPISGTATAPFFVPKNPRLSVEIAACEFELRNDGRIVFEVASIKGKHKTDIASVVIKGSEGTKGIAFIVGACEERKDKSMVSFAPAVLGDGVSTEVEHKDNEFEGVRFHRSSVRGRETDIAALRGSVAFAIEYRSPSDASDGDSKMPTSLRELTQYGEAHPGRVIVYGIIEQ